MNKIKIIAIAAFMLSLCATSTLAQTDTNPPPDTNAPSIIDSPIWQFVTTESTNWFFATGATYDVTTKTGGAWLGAAYKLSDFVVPVIRLDAINGGVFIPSGNLQLQIPVKLFGKLEVIPLAFTGIATSINNYGNSGNAIGVFGTGAAIRLPQNDKWYIPDDLVGDYERWTGGGFNDNQIRLGAAWKF